MNQSVAVQEVVIVITAKNHNTTILTPDFLKYSGIVLRGNFSYDIASNTADERLASLYQAIDNWQVDLETYKDIVKTKFLAKPTENRAVAPMTS